MHQNWSDRCLARAERSLDRAILASSASKTYVTKMAYATAQQLKIPWCHRATSTSQHHLVHKCLVLFFDVVPALRRAWGPPSRGCTAQGTSVKSCLQSIACAFICKILCLSRTIWHQNTAHQPTACSSGLGHPLSAFSSSQHSAEHV